MSLPVSRTDRISGALYGSLIGDAICLATHWIYDPEELSGHFTPLRHFADPSDNPYHSGRQPGEFTHYGDQALCLMEAISVADGFSIEGFEKNWRAMWSGYDGYVDGATRQTLRNGRSNSRDLAGAARIAPLLVSLHEEDEGILLQAVSQQTSITHGHPDAIDAARFFALLTRALIDGRSWEDSWRKASGLCFESLDIARIEKRVRGELGSEPGPALDRLGRACSVEDGFAATLYFLLRSPASIDSCLSANSLAGGDSAARGLLLGLVLGARDGIGHIPEYWIQGLRAHSMISEWLESQGCDPAA